MLSLLMSERSDPCFLEWFPLSASGLEHAPEGAAAVQLRRADGLVRYPKGKSAMVYYFYAGENARDAIKKLFADEIEKSGARDEGELWFRYLQHPLAREHLENLYGEFEKRFGAAPIFNQG